MGTVSSSSATPAERRPAPIDALAAIVGAAHLSTDPDVLASRSTDWTGRYRGQASALVRPGSAEELAAVLTICRKAGSYVTVQGGRTSLVAGTVPEHHDVLLSTERLTELGTVDIPGRKIRAGAGVTLASVQRSAAAAGLLFGVDLSARDSATVGGMASTDAGGLHTVRYGSMRASVLELDVVLPDGSLVRRHRRPSMFVGAEGTLGVVTAVVLALHPIPAHRATAVCRFGDLGTLATVARRVRDIATISALELLDGRALKADARWLMLVELAGDADQTQALAAVLDDVPAEPAIGIDAAGRQRLWQLRESLAEIVTEFGPPLKFDVSLPLGNVAPFEAASGELIARHAPEAIPVLFGHIGEGNLHLNVLRCDAATEAEIYTPMMALIAAHGGNVTSEHGVGTRKRAYLSMARTSADIAAMRATKEALDPVGYLNAAVLFD